MLEVGGWELEVGGAPPLTESRADCCLAGVGAGLEDGRLEGEAPCWRLLRTSRGSSVAGEEGLEGEAFRMGLEAWVGLARMRWEEGRLDLGVCSGAAGVASGSAGVLPLETGRRARPLPAFRTAFSLDLKEFCLGGSWSRDLGDSGLDEVLWAPKFLNWGLPDCSCCLTGSTCL